MTMNSRKTLEEKAVKRVSSGDHLPHHMHGIMRDSSIWHLSLL